MVTPALITFIFIGVNYDLINDKNINYLSYDLIVKETPLPVKETPLPKVKIKPSNNKWTHPGIYTIDQMVEHLTRHPNHSRNGWTKDYLASYTFKELEELHNHDHEQKKGRRKRILFFSANWCGACKKAKNEFTPWLSKSGWKINETNNAHIQIVDYDTNSYLVAKYHVTTLPTVIVIEDDRAIIRTVYTNKETLANLIK